MARLFNGTSDYIAADAAAGFSEQRPYSVGLWVTVAGSGRNLYSEGRSSTNNPFLQLKTYFDGVGSLFTLVIRNDSGGSSQVDAPHSTSGHVDDGNWHHFLFTQDGAATCTFACYVDGVLDSGLSGSYTSGTTTINRLTLGAFRGATIATYWASGIAEAAVWHRQLGADHAAALFAGLSPLALNPAHYWPLETDAADHGYGVGAAGQLHGTSQSGTAPARASLYLPRGWRDQFSPLFRPAPPAPITISPPPASLTLDAAAPALTETITTPAASITLDAAAPSLSETVTAAAGTVTFDAAAPTISGPITITAPAATVAFDAAAPTLEQLITATPATTTFDAAAPATRMNLLVTAAPASITFDAAAPATALVGAAGGTIPAASFTPGTEWRLVICTAAGLPISVISGVAHTKQIIAQLNRPMQASFIVPADDPRINTIYGPDGRPFLWPGIRTIKWYRKEADAWVLRFNGYVWSINPAERDPDSSVVDVQVTCFDPLQRLMKRVCRDSTGGFADTVKFTSVAGTTIAKTLVDRTISYRGPVGIETSGHFDTRTAPQTVTYDQAFVGQAIVDLCDTMTMDVIFQPVDRTDGILAVMSAVAERGHDRPGAIFGYDLPPHSAVAFNRTVTMDDFANDITLFTGPTTTGKKEYSSHRTNGASAAEYGWYEDAQVLTDVTDQTLLDALADTAIQLRKVPRDVVGFRPIPEKSPSPWINWWLGDTVRFQASNQTGAAVAGSLRIYGATIDITDNGYENVSELLVSADAES